jgi:acyl-CoA hydrolase
MRSVSEQVIIDRLAAINRPSPLVVISGNFATPWKLVRLADQALPACRVFVLNPQPGWPCREGFILETPFVGPGARKDPHLEYLPMRLSLVPRLFDSLWPPDAVLIHTSPPRGGKVSLGIEVNILPAAIERVRRSGGLVVAQMNRYMPFTGGDALIDEDDIDLALEVDGPLPSPTASPADDASTAIGEQVARYAVDGGTLQLGIGQVPDTAAHHLRNRRSLRVWSEMVSDGVLRLEQDGALDRQRPICASFLFGSPELYTWAEDNPRLVMRRTEVVNDPGRIAGHPALLSINTAFQVDLFAQANASYVHGTIYSGFGGQPDFVEGALHSKGGQAVVCLRSWHDKTDTSTVVPILTVPACSFQHSVVVSEHGSAELFGRSQHAQAQALIESVADPRARAGLWSAADRLGLTGDTTAGREGTFGAVTRPTNPSH